MDKGVEKYGDRGISAIFKEMKQINDREIVRPLKKHQIIREIQGKFLGYLMFLKKKRSGETKARGCADRRPQLLYKSKVDTSSPTVSTESLFITSDTDAKEERNVAIVNIPGAFLQTKASDGTIIKLQGVLVDTLVRVNSKWNEYIQYEGKKQPNDL